MAEREIQLGKNPRIARLPEIEQDFAAFLDAHPETPEDLLQPLIMAFSYDVRAATRQQVATDYGMTRQELEMHIERIINPEDPDHALYMDVRGRFLAEHKDPQPSASKEKSAQADSMDQESSVRARQAFAGSPRPPAPKVEGDRVFQKPGKYRRSQAEIDQETAERAKRIANAILAAARVLAAAKPGERVNMSELFRVVRTMDRSLGVTDITVRIHYKKLMSDNPWLPQTQGPNVRPPAQKEHPWRNIQYEEGSGTGVSEQVEGDAKVADANDSVTEAQQGDIFEERPAVLPQEPNAQNTASESGARAPEMLTRKEAAAAFRASQQVKKAVFTAVALRWVKEHPGELIALAPLARELQVPRGTANTWWNSIRQEDPSLPAIYKKGSLPKERVKPKDPRFIQEIEAHDGEIAFLVAGNKSLITFGEDRLMQIWGFEVPTGLKEVPADTFPLHKKPDAMCFVGDNVIAFAHERGGRGMDYRIHFFDGLRGKTLPTSLSTYGTVTAMASFGENGLAIADLSRDIALHLLPSEPQQIMAEPQRFSGHSDRITALATTRDRKVISASLDKTIRVWDSAQKDPLLVIDSESNGLYALFPSGSSRLVGFSDTSLKVWDLNSGDRLESKGIFSKSATQLPNGKIAYLEFDGTLFVFDPFIGRITYHNLSEQENAVDIAALPDNSIVIGYRDGRMRRVKVA